MYHLRELTILSDSAALVSNALQDVLASTKFVDLRSMEDVNREVSCVLVICLVF